MRLRALAALAVLCLLATACGSTVQIGPGLAAGGAASGEGVGDTPLAAGDGLSLPAATTGGAATAAGGVGAPGPVTGAGAGGPAVSTGGQGAGAGAGGAASTDPGADAPPPPGGAAAPAPGGQVLAGSGPGITDTEIKLGIVTVGSGSDAGLDATGFGGVAIGDPQGNWEALIADLNARGGVAGRTVVPVFRLLDITTTTPEADLQASCTHFTQDDPVFAVASDIVYYASFASCMEQAGRAVIYPALMALDGPGFAAHPLLVLVAGMTLSRIAAGIPAGLERAGYFTAADPVTPVRVGLLRVDAPPYAAAAATMREALAAVGVELAAEVAVAPSNSAGSLGASSAGINNAVLRFRADGITHVLFLTTNAGEPTLFMNAAESQGYQPRYGLSSVDVPAALADLITPSQLAGAVGVGWLPVYDVAEAQDPGDVPSAARCLQVLRDGGQPVTSRTEQTVAISSCDAAGLFQAAGDRMAAASGTAFAEAVQGLGSGYPSALTWQTAFGPGVREGAAVYRTTAYDAGCSCFAYTSGDLPLPRP